MSSAVFIQSHGATACSHCRLAIDGVIDKIDLKSPCTHLGLHSFMLALLLYGKEWPIYMPFTYRHTKLWPFPFFASYESLLDFISWGKKNFSSIQLQLPHLEDAEMFDICFRSSSKSSIRWISEKKGFGLFANRVLVKGTKIGIYTGLVRPYSKKEHLRGPYIASVPRPIQSLFSFFSPKWVIDANRGGSPMRYINHEKTNPGVGYEIFFWREIPLLGITAIRDIFVDEEISIDYGPFWNFDE